MFGRPTSSPYGIDEIERRLRSLENRLEHVGGRASAMSSNATDRIGDTIGSALTELAKQWRERTGVTSDDVARIGSEATRLGGQAVRRLSHEVEHRPLVMLAVAAGVGLLMGLASHRR